MALIEDNLTCTPDGLVNKYDCTKCLSKTELMAVLALVLYALNNRGSTTLTSMLNDGKCLCISEHQFWESIVNAFLALAIANGYFDDAADATHTAECLTCANPQTIRGIILANLCEYLNGQFPVLL